MDHEGKNVFELTAGACMTRNPQTISANELATAALNTMEQRKITSLAVVDEDDKLVGVIHLHDLWGTEMM